MPDIKMLPTLSQLLPLDNIPDGNLGIKDSISSVFEDIYVKNLIVGKSDLGDSGHYSLDLVTFNSLGVELPFVEDLKIAFNPSIDGTSVIPVSFSYSWIVLRYLRDFSVGSFDNALLSILDILLDFLEIEPSQLLQDAINAFFPVENGLQSFIDAYNNIADTSNQLSNVFDPETSFEDKVAIVTEAIEDFDLEIIDMISEIFFESDEDPIENLQLLFDNYFEDIESKLAEILNPDFNFIIDEVALGIQFPRKWLVPLYTGDEGVDDLELDDPLPVGYFSYLKFNAGRLNYNPKKGFVFDKIGAFELPRSGIGETGLIAEFTNLKVDLSSESNIQEAYQDGRDVNFKGVYVEDIKISLPPFLAAQAGNTAEIFAKNLLIGNEGGVSGLFGIRGIDNNIDTNLVKFYIDGIDPDNNNIPSGISVNHSIKEVSVAGYTLGTSGEEIESDPEVFSYSIYPILITDSTSRTYQINPGNGQVSDVTNTYSAGLLKFNVGDTIITLNHFYVAIDKDEVVSSSIFGTIDNPNFDNELAIVVDISNGFLIKILGEEQIINNPAVSIILQELELGNLGGLWRFGIAAEIESRINLPLLERVLPSLIDINHFRFTEGQPSEFDILLKWENGIEAGGNDQDGFNGMIPLNLNIENFLYLEKVKFNINAVEGGTDISTRFFGARVKIGPVEGYADGMGLNARIRRSDSDEATGGIDLGETNVALEFIGPLGLGVKIDAGKVVGAGYLYIDTINEKYQGYFYLNVAEKFALTVVALLETKLPDDEDGYSFLGLVTLDLPKAIPIAFGFYLKGVGGLVALNRDMDSDIIRESVRTGALDNILFPEIDFENVNSTFSAVLSDLDSAFPTKEGRHAFALMGKFNYAEKNNVTLDLGFLISVPAPLTIGLAGVLHIRQPEETGDKVKINAAFLALVDFGEKLFSLDVTVYDSEIAEMQVEGDLAARFGWGDNNRQFIISAGGFHPAYEVSDVFKIGTLKRISIIIRDEEDFRLLAEAYTAVTSNTFQVGARADLYAKVGAFSITAYIGFEALFNFDPFYFLVRFFFGVALKHNDKSLFAIELDINVKGPKAWHVKGFASFKLLGFEKEFKIDKVFGDDQYDEIEGVEVLPILLAELEKNSSWTAIEAVGQETVSFVSLDPSSPDAVVVDTHGSLKISEQLVPLELPMNFYGEKPIEGPSFFEIDNVKIHVGSTNEEVVATESIEDYFAPAQFVQLSDQEKLSTKSYELQVNGVELKGSQFEHQGADHATTRDLIYESIYRDGILEVVDFNDDDINIGDNYSSKVTLGRLKPARDSRKLTAADVEASLMGDSSAQSRKYRRTNRLLKRKKQVRIKPVEYALVSRSSRRDVGGSGTTHSRTKAELLRRDNVINGPLNKDYAVATNHVIQTELIEEAS